VCAQPWPRSRKSVASDGRRRRPTSPDSFRRSPGSLLRRGPPSLRPSHHHHTHTHTHTHTPDPNGVYSRGHARARPALAARTYLPTPGPDPRVGHWVRAPASGWWGGRASAAPRIIAPRFIARRAVRAEWSVVRGRRLRCAASGIDRSRGCETPVGPGSQSTSAHLEHLASAAACRAGTPRQRCRPRALATSAVTGRRSCCSRRRGGSRPAPARGAERTRTWSVPGRRAKSRAKTYGRMRLVLAARQWP
jgi:hypothetical protein